jgi:arabinofuranosyltransferase
MMAVERIARSSPLHSGRLSPVVPPRQRSIVIAFLLAAFTYIFLVNAWLGDDSYITFRVVWNFVRGYGPVFNPGERVQAYTHPLWMLTMSVAHAITREFFFTAIAVSYAFMIATLLRAIRSIPTAAGAVAAVAWLLSSKAFVDYTASGLEYPLSYFLLTLFYTRFFASDEPLTTRDARWLGVIAGLAFVNRIDSVLLYVAPLVWLGLREFRRPGGRLIPLISSFAVPVLAWVTFATFYYGFPLPNTYYAKVAAGIPKSLIYRQGVAYVFNSFSFDPITLGTIGLATALALRASLAIKAAAVSALLYVLYTISVGGDFMSGRFFAMPFLVSVLMLSQMLRDFAYQPMLVAGLVACNILLPLAPVKSTPLYDAGWPWRTQNGVRDERGHTHKLTNLLAYSPFRDLPDHTWVREGLSFRNGPDKVTVQGSIGWYGLAAGPDKYLIDRNALSEPLLARLPVSPRLYFEFYSGHFFRDIPDGYVETVATRQNRIVDPAVHAYYDRLQTLLQGPLFSSARFKNIWYLNLGAGRRFAQEYEQRRQIDLSIRAANERFRVDAGDKDTAAGVIRSVDRAGYLQYGPGIPMKRGGYRARWIGTITGAPEGPFGFVDVWDGETLVARRAISVTDVQEATRVIAEITFALPTASSHLEYRIWLDGRPKVTLERVELQSVVAVTGQP